MIRKPPGQLQYPVARATTGTRTAARSAARAAARDRAAARYVRLDCDHLTTRETIEAYAVFQPGRGRYWCENCQCWRGRARPAPPRQLPDEPLF